jgi:neutral amino acid transport system permease protein
MPAQSQVIKPGRRQRVGLALLLAFFGFLVVGMPSAAAESQVAYVGVISNPDGDPVEGLVITATRDGEIFTAVSGPDGAFRLELPDREEYLVEVDVTTLPAGLTLRNPDQASRTIKPTLGGDNRLLLPLIFGEPGDVVAGPGSNFGERFVQLFFGGLIFGIMIALGALGLNLIFGTTGLTNFSHGELLALGAFTALVINQLGLPIIIAAPIAVAFSAVVYGWGQNKILWRPLRKRRTGMIAAMIVTIGLAIVLRNFLLLVFTGSPSGYAEYVGMPGVSIGTFNTTPKALIMAGVSIVVIIGVVLWLQKSRLGKATRAVSDNPALASVSGINVEKVISVVWMIAAGLAALAGIYLGLTEELKFDMGQRILLIMFASVVLGGLGTIYGAIVGALLIGVFMNLGTFFIPPEMKTAGALIVMIIILLVRPQGILGRKERVG